MYIRNIICIIIFIFTSNQAIADWQVWTVTQTTRVLRHDPPGNTLSVRLSAARNEWENFQILMRSDTDVSSINIEPGDLEGPDGVIIRAEDARLYRQHQLEIDVPTHRNDNFVPGWYPDPLIPFRHPLTREPLGKARFKAVPFELPADQTHGFWVDVYVPSDAQAGEYHGVYHVTSKNQKTVEIPISLIVWDFSLPRISTLVTALGSPPLRMRRYYRERNEAGKEKEPTDWQEIETQCSELVARHRINAMPPEGIIIPEIRPDGTYMISDEQIRYLREFIDTYHVNAVRVQRPTEIVKDPDQESDKLHAWLKSWDSAAERLNRPNIVFYTYLRDEPNTEEQYKFVQKWGSAIRKANSVVKVMVVEQTWTAPGAGGQKSEWGDLYGAVDIWCPLFSLFRPESAAKRQTLGETIWTYTALCQREPTPWWHIDFPLLNYRAPAWISWRYRIRGLLYWGGMSYWRAVEDPWIDPKTLDRRNTGPNSEDHLWNGEGTIVYPGRAAGYEGIAPSLRLKALRDSIEDYEYLAILERAGLADKAQSVIMPLAESWFHWEKDPVEYEKARAKLANMIINAEK